MHNPLYETPRRYERAGLTDEEREHEFYRYWRDWLAANAVTANDAKEMMQRSDWQGRAPAGLVERIKQNAVTSDDEVAVGLSCLPRYSYAYCQDETQYLLTRTDLSAPERFEVILRNRSWWAVKGFVDALSSDELGIVQEALQQSAAPRVPRWLGDYIATKAQEK